MQRNFFLLILVLCLLPLNVSSETENTIIASRFDSDTLNLTNGIVDSEWTNITYDASIAEFGSEGMVKFSNNMTHIFSLFKFQSNKEWVAVEFGAYDEFCMARGNDGWTFYVDQSTSEVTFYDEIYDGSAGPPEHDQVNDLSIEVIQEGGYLTLEIVREFNTNDGNDLTFADGDLWQVKFASSTHHATGGIDNPTSFGPSDIYFLSVQTSGEIVIPVVPQTIDYDFWKMVIFFGIFISIFLFVLIHGLIRQVFRPLSHPNAIVNKEFVPPTLSSRWEETFGKQTKKQQNPKSKGTKVTGGSK